MVFTTYPNIGNSSIWIVNSGATTHITCSLDNNICFSHLNNQFVYLPTRNVVEVKAIGSVKLNNHITLHKVLFILDFKVNLLSVSSLTKFNGTKISFDYSCFDTHDPLNSKEIGQGSTLDGLYILHDSHNKSTSFLINSSHHTIANIHTYNDPNLIIHKWHSRLGHLSDAVLRLLISNKSINLPSIFSCQDCCICPLAKQKFLSFPNNHKMADSCFDLVHCDQWGPFHIVTYDHYKYVLTFVDDHSRFTWVFFY